MAFADFQAQEQGIQLLQRSLDRGRLAHGYLFAGSQISELERFAMTLAKTLNCANPVRGASGAAIDCCDKCLSCRKIQGENHGDIHWVRPESKSRIILIAQIRELNSTINLKPNEATYKVGIVVNADRLNEESANAFLKTLEEPPANSVFVLLTTDSSRIIETILSRCLRLSFGGEGQFHAEPAQLEFVKQFAKVAAGGRKSLLGRYLVLEPLLLKLAAMRKEIEANLEARSPLTRHPDAEGDLRDKWEAELKAAIEAEYRRARGGLLLALEFWLRDLWLAAIRQSRGGEGAQTALLTFPEVTETQAIAQRVTPEDALTNLELLERLQGTLHTNVNEALALEVALLKLKL